MCKSIIHQPSPPEQPRDLICPDCRAVCHFSSAQMRIHCPTCNWAHSLTYVQHAELLDAILGIATINLPAYLQNLHVPDAPLPPGGGAFPRLPIICEVAAANPYQLDKVAA